MKFAKGHTTLIVAIAAAVVAIVAISGAVTIASFNATKGPIVVTAPSSAPVYSTPDSAMAASRADRTTTLIYEDFDAPEYTIEDDYIWNLSNFGGKWMDCVFLGFPCEPQAVNEREVENGRFHVKATPFTLTMDDTLDHIKYFAISSATFAVPEHGSLTFSADIEAKTPGTNPARTVCPTDQPGCTRTVLEGQQASATLHMINFDPTSQAAGQLMDWLVSENKAFALTERLLAPLSAVGLEGGYTQIIGEFDITPGLSHNYAIRYTRSDSGDKVEWLLDGKVVAKQHKVGIPLDVQNKNLELEWPSAPGATGSLLKDGMDNMTLAHGLFSLLDDYPFTSGMAPGDPNYDPALDFSDYFVSYPPGERLFDQGAEAWFDNFTVVTETKN